MKIILQAGLALSAIIALSSGAAARPAPDAPAPVVMAIVLEKGANLLHDDFQVAGATTGLPANAPSAQAVALPGPGPFEQRLKAAQAGPLGRVPAGQLLHVQGTHVYVYNAKREPEDIFFSRDHGTYVLSSAAGRRLGVSPQQRFIFVLGSGEAWSWVAKQPWIDIVSTSYEFLVGGDSGGSTAGRLLCPGAGQVRAVTASGKPVFAAGGNGTPELHATAPAGLPEVIRVGGHAASLDQELLVTRPYEISDDYAVQVAKDDADSGAEEHRGTSFATPRAAARGALLISEARRLLRDQGAGVRGGRLAVAGAGTRPPSRGPLSDGALTADELRRLLQDTATPSEADPSTRYLHEGFGRLGEAQMRLAGAILAGTAPAPDRGAERGQHEQLQRARALITSPPRCDPAG